MVQWFLGSAFSFLLGDIIGPGLVVGIFLILALICVIRGYKTLAYSSVAVSIGLGIFLSGAQLEKKNCNARIQKILDVQKLAEEAEIVRQAIVNQELAKLRDQNFVLTDQASKLRSKNNVQIIREIKTQVVEKCRSARWTDLEFDRVQSSSQRRRIRSGN